MQPKRNNNDSKTCGRSRGGGMLGKVMLGSVMGLAACVAVALSTPGLAQNAGVDAWKRGGCSTCHGNVAEGGSGDVEPAGPNLRRTRLDRDELIETISCGRPGAEMPYNLKGAYTETSCYGLPVGEVPAETRGTGFLAAEEVEALVDFLLENVVGKTRITRQACAVFFGGNEDAIACRGYR